MEKGGVKRFGPLFEVSGFLKKICPLSPSQSPPLSFSPQVATGFRIVKTHVFIC